MRVGIRALSVVGAILDRCTRLPAVLHRRHRQA